MLTTLTWFAANPVLNALVWFVVIAGAVAIACIVAGAMGFKPPAWFVQVCWVVAAVAVGVLAIRLIASF